MKILCARIIKDPANFAKWNYYVMYKKGLIDYVIYRFIR